SSSARNAGDHLCCPETKPGPHPSSGGKRRVRILAGTTDGRDGLIGNVGSQRRYAAHLNAQSNASCESFIKTLKREEIYANRYDNLAQLRANIEEFIEQYYNRQRLHSARGKNPLATGRASHCAEIVSRAAKACDFAMRPTGRSADPAEAP